MSRVHDAVRVAAVQMCSQADVPENLTQAALLVGEAAARGAKLIVLPEACFFLGPEKDKARVAEHFDHARKGPGPMHAALSSWAVEHGVWIIAGGVPEASGDENRPFNTSLVVRSDGKITARYRKMHLFDVSLSDGTKWHESSATMSGDAPIVTEAAGVSLGLSICYDLRFPELFAWQKRNGAELLTVPAAFTKTTGDAHWHVLLRARAIENQCFLVAAAQQGRHPLGRETYGHSVIVDPWGRVDQERSEPGPGVVVSDLDMAELRRVRETMPVDRHRRSIVDDQAL